MGFTKNAVKTSLQMVELDKLKEIRIHPMTWKQIMKYFNDPFSDRKDLELCISSYLINFGIFLPPEKFKKKVPNRITRERVKRHRMDKKRLGYRQVCFMVSPADFDRLQAFKRENGLTYSETLNKLLNK